MVSERKTANGIIAPSATLDAVFENVLALRSDAQALLRRSSFGTSTHVSIAAIEEISKYLIIYCREHIPPKVWAKRFSHVPKHRLASVPYFISGEISVVHLIGVVSQIAQATTIGPPLEVIAKAVMGFLDRGMNPEKTAETIMKMLTQHEDDRVEKQRRETTDAMEKRRTTSIYVDVDDGLHVTSLPSAITKKDAVDYFERVDVGIAALRFLRDPSMTTQQYIELLPSSWRKQFERDLKPKIKSFRAIFSTP